MLLSKKIIISFVILIILVINSTIAISQQTQCDISEIKDTLRKALFEYFASPSSSKLSVNEIKDFLHFYISLDTNQLTVDCSGSGPLSGKPYYLMLGVARNTERSIPKCGDGTEYGKCSSNGMYCYGGKIEERCKICGCGENEICDKSMNKCVPITGGCTENWKCTEWGSCIESLQTRTCTDLNNCGTFINKPAENQSCWAGKVGEVIRITTNSAKQVTPSIYGDKIIWTDFRNIPASTYDYGTYGYGGYGDIYMYDLVTKEETRITASPTAGVRPVIYGDKIVWSDFRDPQNYTGYNFYGKGDIYMYDITTGKETPISTVIGSQLAPHIYENKIVWYDYRDSNYDTDIYMYDLTTRKETKISEIKGLDKRADHSPRVHGNRIIWYVYNDKTRDWDIYMYEISTGRQTQITKGQEMEVGPDIYGDKIVWVTQYEGGTYEFPVYVYDINTKKQTRITSHHSTNFFPKIHGNRIVWMDYRTYNTYNPDIYMYDLTTGKETPVVTDKSYQAEPAIYDDKVVWMDHRNGNYDIYMAIIS